MLGQSGKIANGVNILNTIVGDGELIGKIVKGIYR